VSLDLSSLIDNIVGKLENRVHEYLVQLVLENKLMVKYARGETSVTQSWRTLRLGLYLAKDNKIAISSLSAENPDTILNSVISALDLLRPSPFYAPLPEPSGENSAHVDKVVKEVVETGDASKEVEEIGFSEPGDVAGKVEFWYTEELLVGSNGAELRHEATSFNGYIRVFREQRSGQWSWTSTVYDQRLARGAIERATELAELCRKLPTKRVEPGKYRVLLSPMVAGNLVEHVAMAASAGSIIFGTSFLQGRKPGEKVLSEKLTLWDKPRDNTLPGFRGFDAEGVATIDKTIIRRGILETILHNSKTAKLMGARTTGNAGWIMPAPFNLEVEPGDARVDELIEEMRNGIYITNNWYTRFQNHVEGVFSTVSRDAVIVYEDAEPSYCTERIRIADTMPRLFSSIELIGREQWPIQWWEVRIPTRIPHILFKEAYISLPQ